MSSSEKTDTVPAQQTNQFPINGLILAGGRSSRMGKEKRLIVYHQLPQQEYLFTLLTEFCNHVYTSCKLNQEIPTELNPLPDHFEVDSPLNGILSAFHHDSSHAWLTVPVDMPMIDRIVIQFLLQHRDPEKIATCYFDSDGKNPEPLFALWEAHAAKPLLKFYEAGNFSPRDFLNQSDIKLITVPHPDYLLNANTPDEVKLWQRISRSRKR
ncbi:MAG: NTP transferase domain-containing protein [Cyclobacteriaceae bacterium]|nr:NTP transferase domain-containing protein [Cyclobacteriaceae bacterium]